MADAFELKLELNLRRIALVSVAEIFWKSPKIVKHVAALKKELSCDDSPVSTCPRKFKDWERVIAKVLKKTNRLKLPSVVKVDLSKMIVLTGEKIYSYYKHLFVFSKCEICPSMVGPATYSFSNHGVLKNPCLSFHWKFVPRDKHGMRIGDLLWAALPIGDSKVISKYKDETIKYLEYNQTGFNLTDKKNFELNAITILLYYYCHNEETHPYQFRRVPEKYLQNTDYIIPLEKAINEFGIGEGNHGVINYYKYLNSKNLLLDLLPNLDMFSNLQAALYKICREAFPRVYRYEDKRLEDFLYAMKFLPSHQMLEFIQKNIREITVSFLPIWPFRELMPKIFGFLLKRNVDLDYQFLLEFVALIIGFQNRKRRRYNAFYLQLFSEFWLRAPERVNVGFFENRAKVLASKKMNSPSTLTEKFYRKYEDALYQLLSTKCEDLKKEKRPFVRDFVDKIVIFEGEFEKFYERYDFVYCHR